MRRARVLAGEWDGIIWAAGGGGGVAVVGGGGGVVVCAGHYRGAAGGACGAELHDRDAVGAGDLHAAAAAVSAFLCVAAEGSGMFEQCVEGVLFVWGG